MFHVFLGLGCVQPILEHLTHITFLFSSLFYFSDVLAAKYLGGLMSDNQWGLTLRAADGLLLQDWSIVGSSKEILDHTEANSMKQCPYTSWDMIGITMQHVIQRTGHLDPGTGIRYKNVTMSGEWLFSLFQLNLIFIIISSMCLEQT